MPSCGTYAGGVGRRDASLEAKLAANVRLSRDTQTDIDRFAGLLKSSSGENTQIAECERLRAAPARQQVAEALGFRNRSGNSRAQANVDVRAEQDRAKVAADGAAVFVPECLTCGYELTGLADGACPECGKRFRHAALRAEFDERRANSGFGMYIAKPFAWMTLVIVIACSGAVGADRHGQVSVVWALFAGVLFAMRALLFGSRVGTLVFIAGAVAVVTMSYNADTPPFRNAIHGHLFLNRLFVWSAGLCATALLLGRWRWVLWAWASLLIGIGFGIELSSVTGVLRNEHWSRWPDIRSGDPYSQYPFTNPEAAMVGAAAIGIGLVALLLIRRVEPFVMDDPQADRSTS